MNNKNNLRGCSIFVLGIALVVPATAWARADGFLTQPPANCSGCHTAKKPPEITVKFDKDQLGVAETVTIDIAIKATDADAYRAGVRIDSDGQGEFELVDSVATRLYSPTQGVHARPMSLNDGKANFKFKWKAPDKVGVSRFQVFATTSVSPPSSGSLPTLFEATYSSNRISVDIAHGCKGVLYYPDSDKDGFGDQKDSTLSCEPIAGLITKGGDCDDREAKTNPDAREICDGADNDCDGMADDGLEPGLYYKDADGDGYASSKSSSPISACNDKMGYAMKRGDCDDTKSEVNPGAEEKCDGLDNNCNGQIDDLKDDKTCDKEAADSGGGCSVGRGWSPGPLPITVALVLGAMVAGRLTRRRRR